MLKILKVYNLDIAQNNTSVKSATNETSKLTCVYIFDLSDIHVATFIYMQIVRIKFFNLIFYSELKKEIQKDVELIEIARNHGCDLSIWKKNLSRYELLMTTGCEQNCKANLLSTSRISPYKLTEILNPSELFSAANERRTRKFKNLKSLVEFKTGKKISKDDFSKKWPHKNVMLKQDLSGEFSRSFGFGFSCFESRIVCKVLTDTPITISWSDDFINLSLNEKQISEESLNDSDFENPFILCQNLTLCK